MKKTVILFLLLLMLTGCSQPVWETVQDSTEIPAMTHVESTYSIEIGVPQELHLLDETEDWQVYTTEDGSFEVETGTFLASNLTSAVKMLTGYEEEQLNILQTERFDLPEYQFAWVSQTEEGARLSRADLIMDGVDCYAVVCSTMEEVGSIHAQAVSQVISTFGLYTDEGV